MMKRHAIYLFALCLALISCGEEAAQQNLDIPLEDRIDLLIEQNEYNTALDVLSGQDMSGPEIAKLKEKVHLNYGLHSMNTFDQTEMRTRMNNALSQFTEVLRINPDNSAARQYIQQILDIYATIPDRSPEKNVMEGLRDVGFDQ